MVMSFLYVNKQIQILISKILTSISLINFYIIFSSKLESKLKKKIEEVTLSKFSYNYDQVLNKKGNVASNLKIHF